MSRVEEGRHLGTVAGTPVEVVAVTQDESLIGITLSVGSARAMAGYVFPCHVKKIGNIITLFSTS